MNIFIFSGNIGSDAEVRHTPKGDAVTSFNVASTSGFGDKKTTTWIRCNAWGERYTKIAQYLLKGKRVTISGEFSQREWEDKEGVKKYSCEVRVSDIDLPPKGEDAPQARQAASEPKAASYDPFEDSEIPF